MEPGYWNRRRVLVTGATGIIGSWLTRNLLQQGADVAVLISDEDGRSDLVRSGAVNRVHVVSGRLEIYEDVERAIVEPGVDTVFHLGAQAIVAAALRSPRATFESNIRGTYNLLDACRLQLGTVSRIVIASSDKAYGSSNVLPYTEDMPPLGRHPYDVSKSCTDLLAVAYAATYGLPVAVARCGNVYGGGDLHWDRLVPGTIRSLLEGRPPEIRSDGTSTRDYIHVDDIVNAYLTLACQADRDGVRGEAFNFSFGRARSVTEMVGRIIETVGIQIRPRILDVATAEIAHQHLDPLKAKRVLGWSPAIPLDEGLRRTVDWYREYLAA